jgi:hypothetical protein
MTCPPDLPLSRTTFNRHRDAIFNMFRVIIECGKGSNVYHIANDGVLADGSIEQWLMSTLTVNMALSDSATVKDRILLEDVPAGEEYLPTIMGSRGQVIDFFLQISHGDRCLGIPRSVPATTFPIPSPFKIKE